jgi:hypothetical protein
MARGNAPAWYAKSRRKPMIKQFKIVVEKHPDAYVAYPLGTKGVVVGKARLMTKPWPMSAPPSASTWSRSKAC